VIHSSRIRFVNSANRPKHLASAGANQPGKLSKQFPGTKALDNVSFSLEEGEIHALVGENGAGKSTLMNIISGIFKPDSGELFISGKKCDFFPLARL
jgi:ABC-type sugar transport system ATPase subunit